MNRGARSRLLFSVRMRRAVAAVAALLFAGPVAPPATGEESFSQTYIRSGDGTLLHAEVLRPDRRGRVPVVVLLTPYANGVLPTSQRQPGGFMYNELEDLFDRGYAIVQVSVRGFGASGGCGDLGGKGEQMDAKAVVEWAASQPWSTGRVGMWGISYDGWTQIMALAMKPRGLAAVVAQAPLAHAYGGFFMNRAHYAGGWWATASIYGQMDLKPPHAGTGQDGLVNALTGTATNPCHGTNVSQTALGDPKSAYWTERDLVARAAQSTVPVLWSHGFLDAQVKPDHLTALYPKLRGPKRAWVGQWLHQAPTDPEDDQPRDRWNAEAFEWLDAYVKRDPAALRRVNARPRAVVQNGDGLWRGDDAWPPRDAVPARFPLRTGTYVEYATDNGSELRERGGEVWTFSQPLPYAVHLSGVPRVSLSAKGAGPAQVVVKVYDVAPDGGARMVTRGVHAGVSGQVSFDLYPEDWVFRPGHRIGVVVRGSDAFWTYPAGGGQVAVGEASIVVPALRYVRTFTGVGGGPGQETVLSQGLVRANESRFALPPRQRRR